MDLSAAYDAVYHRVLLTKLYVMTVRAEFTKLIRSMMNNRRFYVELSAKKSSWRNQKNDLPQGSVLSSVLFNVYTNNQHVHNETRSFIYAGDLCKPPVVATQRINFEQTETILTEVLQNLGEYYDWNHLRAYHDKTQTCAFHPQHPLPCISGSALDGTLSYKEHIHKRKCKHPLGTMSLVSYQIKHGEPSQQPSKQQPLHSANLQRNTMRVLCGKGHHT